MPFVTEELWQQLSDGRESSLISSSWPSLDPSLVDQDANAEMDWVVRLITQVRTLRAEMNVPAKAKVPLLLKDAGPAAQSRMDLHRDLIERLARLESLGLLKGEVPKGALQDIIDEATMVLPLADDIDVAGEQARLEKEIAKLDDEVKHFEEKLANKKFVANAPESVVKTEREKLQEARQARTKMDEALGRLTAAG
jgi:valyl-tRNA synthetase